MMLAIDTASRFLSVALHDGTILLAEQTILSQNQHTVQLSRIIHDLLIFTEHQVQDLTALAISQGPGSYSGLRVGFGVAKGLATACKLPLIPIPTLDILAYSTPRRGENFYAVVQAGRKRIIAGKYQWIGERWQSVGSPEITCWEDLLKNIHEPALINGEIDTIGQQTSAQYSHLQLLEPVWQIRRAGFLAELGWKMRHQQDFRDLAAINPIYLKEPG
jgi:tRNA threonylcarbamoyladenosine biosynthesis protein TsaB